MGGRVAGREAATAARDAVAGMGARAAREEAATAARGEVGGRVAGREAATEAHDAAERDAKWDHAAERGLVVARIARGERTEVEDGVSAEARKAAVRVKRRDRERRSQPKASQPKASIPRAGQPKASQPKVSCPKTS